MIKWFENDSKIFDQAKSNTKYQSVYALVVVSLS